MDCSSCLGNCNKNTNINANNGLPPIVGGFLNVTQRCNLACVYCFVVQQPMEMSYQVAQDAADFYAKNAIEINDIPSITFFGGEPLLRWDDIIVPLTRYIRKTYGERFTLSITSNGVLLDRKKLDFMKENNIGLLFSIDGDKKTQDTNRPFHNGKGSFDMLKDKIPLVLEYYPNMTFRATVDHDNVWDMADNYQFAIDTGYTNVFMIPNIFTEWSEEERKELVNQCRKIADIYMRQLRIEEMVDFSHISEMMSKIKRINNAHARNSFRDAGLNIPAFGRCGLGGTKFASVGATGALYSCQELTENPDLGDKFAIGNIYDGADDKKRWEIINQFDPRTVKNTSNSCNKCLLNNICDGACSINNYFANGNLNIMSDVLCLYYQAMLDSAIYIMNTMAAEDNFTFKEIFQRL